MREGLLPHTVTTVLKFATTADKARAVTELLGEVLDPTETAVSAFEIDDQDPRSAWSVEVFFAEAPDEDAIRALITPLVEHDLPDDAFSTVAARDWVKASLDGLRPVRAGRFLVHGAHDRAEARVNDIAIEIEAGLAFGTGHHGTTAGCLAALDSVLKQRRPRAVLDVGTGTGVLGIAAARALGRRVVAGDIDPVAVAVARDNAALNGARGTVQFYVAPGVRHALANRSRRFDLVMANILARPLMRLARDLARVVAPGGDLILSGLLLADVPGILAAYRLQGFALRRRTAREGWATLVLARGGPRPLTR
jgi:ribosomal protein L11 methyltransferase